MMNKYYMIFPLLVYKLTQVCMNPFFHGFSSSLLENHVDPDQLASAEAS